MCVQTALEGGIYIARDKANSDSGQVERTQLSVEKPSFCNNPKEETLSKRIVSYVHHISSVIIIIIIIIVLVVNYIQILAVCKDFSPHTAIAWRRQTQKIPCSPPFPSRIVPLLCKILFSIFISFIFYSHVDTSIKYIINVTFKWLVIYQLVF